MDTLELLSKGNKVQNPNYNPKTKEGRKQPQYVNGYDIGQDDIGGIAKAFSIGSLDASFNINNPQNRQLLKHNIPIGKDNDEDDINRLKAESQDWMEQLGRGTAQVVVNEVALGTLKGFTDLIDAAANGVKILKGEENDYTSDASLILERTQDNLREKLEIYRRNPDKAFDFSDFGSIANGLVSLGSSFALLIPAAGITGGLSKLGKATKLNKATKILFNGIGNKGVKISRIKAANEFNNFMKVGTTAFISRTAENYMEARQSYKEVYDNALNQLTTMPDDNKKFFFETNPNYVGMSDEDIAKDIASKQATEVFKDDYNMLLMDILEYNSINKIFNSRFRNYLKPSLRVAAKEQNLLISDAAKATEYQNRNKISKWIEQAIQHPEDIGKAIVTGIPFNEAIEEGYQGYKQERIKDLTNLMLDKNANPKFIESYLTNPQILEQAFYGVLCGGLFQGILGGANSIKNKIDDAKNMSKMTPEGKKLYKLTRKSAKDEIRDWVTKLNDLNKNLIDVNNGVAPITSSNPYVTDISGKQVIGEDGMPIRRELTEQEQEEEKSNLINTYLSDLAIKATDKGYYNLFKEFINNPNVTKYMKENGVNDNIIEEIDKDYLKDKLEYAHTIYTDALDLFYNNIPDIDEHSAYGVILAAKQYTADKLRIDNILNKINNINEQLNSQEDYNNLSEQFIDGFDIRQIQAELKYLHNKRAEYYDAYTKGTISKYAYDEYIKENDKLIDNYNNDLLAYKDKYKQIEQVKTLLSEGKGFEEINPLINELLKDSIEDKPNVTSTTSNLLKDKARQKVLAESLEYNLPTGEEQLNEYYRQFSFGVDNYIEQKAQNAVNTIKSYIENRKNLDNIFDELISENLVDVNEKEAKDIKDSLSIVKIGHRNTQDYYQDIRNAIDKEKKRRIEIAEKNNTTVIDGKQVDNKIEPNVKSPVEGEDKSTVSQPVTKPTSQPIAKPEVKPTSQQLDEEVDINNQIEDDTYNADISEAEEKYIEQVSSDIEDTYNEYNLLPEEEDVIGSDITPAQAERYSILVDAEGLLLRKGNFELKDLISKINKFDTSDENYKKALELFRENSGVPDYGKTDEDFIPLFHIALNRFYSLLRKTINSGSLPDIYKHKYNNFVNNFAKLNFVESFLDIYSGYVTSVKESSTEDLLVDEVFNLTKNTINNYIKENGIKNNIISVVDLFQYIINNDKINYEQAKQIFTVLQYVVNNNKLSIYTDDVENFDNNDISSIKEIKFTDKAFFAKYNRNVVEFFEYLANSKSVEEQIANTLHTSRSNNTLSNEEREYYLNELRKNPNQLVIKSSDKYKNSLSIGVNTSSGYVELAYIAKVSYDEKKGTYSSFSTAGLHFIVDSNGQELTSNLDTLFKNLIYAGDDLLNDNDIEVEDKYKHIFTTLNKFKKEINPKTGKKEWIETNLIDEDFKNLVTLYNELGSNYTFNDNWYLPNEDNLTEDSKNRLIAIAKKVHDVLFFKQIGGFDGSNADNYYSQWLNRIYNNYQQTYNIQKQFKDGVTELKASAKNIGIEELNYVNQNVDINDEQSGTVFTKDDNKGNRVNYIISFTDNIGNYITETGEQSILEYANAARFNRNDTGVVIFSSDGNPFIARFTESNDIKDTTIGNAVKAELNALFKQFMNNKLSYDDLLEKLNKLLGSKNGESLIAYGLKFNKYPNRTCELRYNNKPVIRIFSNTTQFDKNTGNIVQGNNRKTIVLYDSDGKPAYYKKDKFNSFDNYLNYITSELISKLKFNRNFNTLDKQKLTKENNEYFYVDADGKYHIMKDIVYDTYFDYVMQNKAFKVNVISDDNGNFTHTSSRFDDNIYIDVTGKVTPSTKELDILKDFNKEHLTKPINVYSLLEQTSIDKDYLQILKEIGFFNNEVYYDYKTTAKSDAKFKDGKIYITARGKNLIARNPNNLTRLLIHENLHARLSEVNEEERNKALDEILDTYRQAYNYFMSYNGVDKDIKLAKQWLNQNLKKNKELFDGRLGAEEWLVESFTRPELFNALNKIKYDGEIEEIKEPNIFQKLLNIILKLFGINNGDIDKNSILAKEYSVLNINSSGLTEFKINNDNTIVEKEVSEELPVEGLDTPSDKDISDTQTIDTNSQYISIEDDSISFDDIVDEYLSSTEDVVDDFYTRDMTKEYIIDNFETIIDNYANGLAIVNGLYVTFQSEQSFLNLFPAEIRQSLADLMANGELKVICR